VYDTAGFLPYLAFDGLDDSMETNNIVPGTDKVQVFAGVRKLSSLDGIIAELSADRNANNGTWTFTQNPLNTPAYFFASKGTSSVSATSATNFSAPITNVLTGIGDISGDVATLRVDGVQVATGTADQGTGNYLTYPLYIGCRFNNPPGTPSSIFFNGWMSSLIVRFGPNLSTSTIQATESWVAGKTGVSI
jgi:hypothetical protein